MAYYPRKSTASKFTVNNRPANGWVSKAASGKKLDLTTFVPSDLQAAIWKAVHESSDNLIIEALAGTGKTTTIEFLYQMLRSMPGGESLKMSCLCFNAEIKDEFHRRALEGSTFNGAGAFYASKAWGYGKMLPLDQKRGVRMALRALGADMTLPEGEQPDDLYNEAKNLANIVSLAKGFFLNAKPDATVAAKQFFFDRTKWIIDRFDLSSPGRANSEEKGYSDEQLVELTRATMNLSMTYDGSVDFNDQIWMPLVGGKVFGFKEILFVDEAQDLNAAQIELVYRMLKKGSGRVIFVGDRNQAIYEWRGALSGAMDDIQKRFNAKIMPLNVTRRCAPEIVAEAQVFVPNFKAHESNPKGIVDQISGVSQVVTQAQVGDFVISRTRAPMFSIAMGMLAIGKRVTIRGKDIAEGLIALVDKSNRKNVAALRNWIDTWESSESERLARKNKNPEEFEKKMSGVRDNAEVIRMLCDKVGSGVVQKVVDLIKELCEKDNDRPSVVIMTAHGSKGLETDRVFMLVETFRKGGQENNLTYVAITRAKRHLTKVVGIVEK